MANEFIIKNGFHSKGDSQITGSLNVKDSLTVNGSAVGAAFPFTGDALITGSLGITGSFSISGSTSLGIENFHIGDGSQNTAGTTIVIGNNAKATSGNYRNVVIGNSTTVGGGYRSVLIGESINVPPKGIII